MFTLPRPNKKASSRSQISIQGINNGVLILPQDKYRMVIEASSINFYLMTEAEQDIIVDTYQAFLNSLSFPIQIMQKIRSIDIKDYLNDFVALKQTESSYVYQRQIDDHINYVQSLVKSNSVLSRQFYIIIACDDNGQKDTELTRHKLRDRLTLIERGLSNVGIKTRALDSLEILDLFYSLYNLSDSRRQPLTTQTIKLLSKNYF